MLAARCSGLREEKDALGSCRSATSPSPSQLPRPEQPQARSSQPPELRSSAREGSRQRPPHRLSPASPELPRAAPTAAAPGPGKRTRGSGQGPAPLGRARAGAARAPWRLSGCTRRLVTVSVSASSSSVCRSSSRSRHPARSRSLSPGPAMAAPPAAAPGAGWKERPAPRFRSQERPRGKRSRKEAGLNLQIVFYTYGEFITECVLLFQRVLKLSC